MATIDRRVSVPVTTNYDVVIHAELQPPPVSSLDAKQTQAVLERVMNGQEPTSFKSFDGGIFDKAMRYFFAALVIGYFSKSMKRWASRG